MNVLALDQGTTSSRAIVFNENLETLSSFSYPVTQYYPQPGWVEHDPLEIFNTQMRAASDAARNCGEQITAVGITNQRETVIVWDKKSGLPVYHAIVWQCRRTASICEELIAGGYSKMIKEKTGLKPDAYFSATKIKWILDHVPQAREKAEHGDLLCGTVDCFLIWKLTGKHFSDVTNASRTMLFNIHTLDWDQELCRLLDIPRKMLPAICNNSGFIGKIRRLPEIPSELWDIPICSCIGDQQSALFGQTCFSCGDVKNTYGTGCFTLMNIGDTPVYDDHLITTVGWKTDKVLVYALEGSVFNAGSSIQWLRDELHIISQARECDLLAESIPDSQGVTFVSSFTGLGAPYWDMYARGTLVGLTRGTGRAQICRAVLEGIAFQVYDLIHAMEIGAKKSVGYLKVDGGASVSDFMMQFQADLLGVPVDRPQNVESTALGAAMLAFIGIGAFQIEDLRQIRKSEKIYKPSMSQTMRLENLTRWQKAVRAVKEFEL